ncbi:uncharacterized protein LOC141651337 [Silene latifolia]|uniref:uncharacterized protein LOC141651337 n=1 Tax=Silene latifolia TaxID=37657 RepID=UPI003D77EBC6
MGLLETRVSLNNSADIIRKFSNYYVLNNYSHHYNGRIWFFLDTRRVTVISSQRLWDELRGLAGKVINWIILGDFNITNKRGVAAHVWSRLDRVLSNPSWLVEYPNTQVNVLPSRISDHSPLLVVVQESYKPRTQFSYLNCWVEHKEYDGVVLQAWGLPVRGSVMFRFFTRLKNVRQSLIQLHKTNFSGISKKVQEAKKDLEKCQLQLQLRPLDPILFEQEQQVLKRYLTFKKTERSSLTQRAKIQSIKYNDAPTSYYFSKIAARKHQSIIGRIKDRQGIEKFGTQEVNHAFIEYYRWLLGQKVDVNCAHMIELKGAKILTSDWEGLCKEVTETEIQSDVFSIDSNKSPGKMDFLLTSLRNHGG